MNMMQAFACHLIYLRGTCEKAVFHIIHYILLFFSFKNQYCSIKYNIKACYMYFRNALIKVGGQQDNFFLQRTMNLTAFPNLGDSICDSKKTSFSCCCSWCCLYISHPLIVTTILPKKTYEMGDFIPITVQIHNSSDVAVKYTVLKVVEDLTFTPDK